MIPESPFDTDSECLDSLTDGFLELKVDVEYWPGPGTTQFIPLGTYKFPNRSRFPTLKLLPIFYEVALVALFLYPALNICKALAMNLLAL